MYLGKSRAICCPRLSVKPVARGTQASGGISLISRANTACTRKTFIKTFDELKCARRNHYIRAAASAALAAAGE